MPTNYSQQHLDYNKQYYQINKERISANRSIKFNCECGVTYTKRHQAAHKQSQQHTKWLTTVPPIESN